MFRRLFQSSLTVLYKTEKQLIARGGEKANQGNFLQLLLVLNNDSDEQCIHTINQYVSLPALLIKSIDWHVLSSFSQLFWLLLIIERCIGIVGRK